MSASHRIVIASPPDRENVVAEIWYGDDMWAEVANEAGVTVEFYPRPAGGRWMFPYEDAIGVLEAAKRRLLEGE